MNPVRNVVMNEKLNLALLCTNRVDLSIRMLKVLRVFFFQKKGRYHKPKGPAAFRQYI